ncbi:MAG: NAD-binding protein [Nitrospirota bacterium]
MYIVVVGGGKVGYHLVKYLRRDNHEVLLIESDPSRAAELMLEFPEGVVEGNGSRVPILKEGGATRADVLVAVTGKDEDNLVICQIAKTVFKCPRTIARVNDPRDEAIFTSMGVDATVSATRLINSMIEEQVKADSMMIPIVTLSQGNAEIIEIDLPRNAKIVGKPIREIPLPAGSRIIAIIRNDDVIVPSGEDRLTSDDKILALVKKGVEKEIRELLFSQ